MKKFFSFVIRQFVAIILIVLLVLGFGVYSALNTPVNLLPDINVPMVCVQVIYPGANAQSVEVDVTEKLEDGLSAISGVTDVSSYSYDNLSALVLSFDYGTDTSDKKNLINSKISGITLPDGITTSVYDIDLNAEALATISVTADSLESAHGAAKELAGDMRAIDGVESVEIKGGAQSTYVLQPFGGLELIAPLLVQAFSYGALDLPLGNIIQDGANVQIRNNTDVTKLADIQKMPVTMPAQIVTLLGTVKRLTGYYSDSTKQDLIDLQTDLSDGVIAVMGDIDGYSSSQIKDFAELKTYMNVAVYDAEQLTDFKKSRYYNRIYEQVTNPPEIEGGERTPKTDEELEKLLADVKDSAPAAIADYLTLDMLKVVRDGKLDLIIAYRTEYVENAERNPAFVAGEYYDLTDEDYFVLETEYAHVYGDLYDTADPQNITDVQRATLLNNVKFARKVSATGLSQLADKKEDAEAAGEQPYRPTNSECALLFTGTELSEEHPIVTSPTFMAFVRSENYTYNMSLLTERRGELEEVGGEITAEQFNKLYNDLKLEGVFEFTLSEKLFGFILNKDFSELAGSSMVVSAEEIADIEEEDEYTSYVYFSNGEAQVVKGAVLEVYKSNGANSSAVVKAVKGVYSDYLQSGDGAVKITLLDDQSEFISDSIVNVLVSMLIGGLLAVLVIFLFLKKIRTSLIVAVTMPLSVLASLICLNLIGVTLNMVSLGGLAVGIGMLVDNSIVVIESITKHREEGKDAFTAAVDGTCEVGGALFGSTLTTVCVFIPIIFSGGLTGEIFTDLSWAVIFSLTFSLIVAVTVIPCLYALMNRKKVMLKNIPGYEPAEAQSAAETQETQPAEAAEPVAQAVETQAIAGAGVQEVGAQAVQSATQPLSEDGKKAKTKKPKKSFKEILARWREPRIMNAITSFYGKILPKVLNKKLVTVLVAVVVFGASVGMLFITGTEFLPAIDKGQIEINMTYPSGVSLEEIQTDASRFANVLQFGCGDKKGVENLDYVSVSVGKNGLLALTDTGIIKLQLKTNRGTKKVVEQIRALADEYRAQGAKVSGCTVKEIDGVVASLMSGSDDMSVTVTGADGDVLVEIANKIKAELESDKNGFKDVKTSAADKTTQYTLKFDRRKMEELGLDYQTTVLTLRIGIASYTACTVNIDDAEYDLKVRFNSDAVPTVTALENFVVGAETDDGAKAIKLKDILQPVLGEDGNPTVGENGEPVKVMAEQKEACIRRTNGDQMVSVSAAHPTLDTGAAGKLMKKVAQGVVDGYEGYGFNQSGISEYLNDAFGGLVVALVVSFVLLYGVMAVQFGSAVKPLIIMSGIPFSFTGGFLALVITGTSLNVVSFIGLIMLMGVIVNNAIVMLEKIKQLHDDGMEHYAAVQQACKVRLRPIFMTTLTTILALIPLAIGVGQGSELMQPLGIVVIGGLLLGTLVTLVLVPAVYCAVHGISAKKPNGRRGK